MGVGLQPTLGTQAPVVTGFESRKSELGMRRRQVVTTKAGEFQKFLRDLDTNGVRTCIIFPGIAAAIAIKTGHRCLTATLELFTKDIF